MKDEPNDIIVEFRLHADLSLFQLSARPSKKNTELNSQDILNALRFAIEHVESQGAMQDFEPNSTH
jgi:hypothetical protein